MSPIIPSAGHRIAIPLFFLVLAILCALPRFGQRENEHQPGTSDSDLYLEMARVFNGDQERFSSELSSWQPHHYNRPLHPFLAGYLGKYFLGGNLRSAFSIIDILAASLIAWLLFKLMCGYDPDRGFAWLPSVLFLTGFPQVNWGYHILTDTFGLATAFATAFYGKWLVHQTQIERSYQFWVAHTILSFLMSSIAFLARETGWMAVITIGYLVWLNRGRLTPIRTRLALIFAALVLGKVPHSIYSYVYHLKGVPMAPTIGAMLDWRYILDFSVKSVACFHIAWALAAIGAWRRSTEATPFPPFFVGWSLGGICYILAGYYVNKLYWIGYPLRMVYVLFPLVYWWVREFFLRLRPPIQMPAVGIFCVVYSGMSLAGVFLDPGRAGITVPKVLDALKSLFLR